MATIAQRLVAAGASPERAAAFEKQFTAARPGLKPREIQDAFDAELGAFSAAQWPYTFRPQELDDTQTIDYFKGVYGENKYNQLIAKTAPAYTQAKASDNAVIKTIVQDIEDGISLADSLAGLRTAWKTPEGRALFGNLTEKDAVNELNKIYTDFSKVSGTAKSFLSNDKYYKANLPHPNLKYGTKTDLAAGIIDFKTNPKVKEIIDKRQQFITSQATPYGPSIESSKESVRFSDKNLFESFSGSKATPFFDEVKRREFLKGKTTK